MTARDYGCFLRAMLRGGELDGKRVLKSETVDTAMSPNIGSIRLPELMKSCEPTLANDVPSLPFAQTWGIGFHLTLEDVPGMRRAGTADWAGIFNLYYWIDRKSGVGATLMTQVLPFFDAGVIDTLLQFESTVYAS
jgi:methyl acetate hydrolase